MSAVACTIKNVKSSKKVAAALYVLNWQIQFFVLYKSKSYSNSSSQLSCIPNPALRIANNKMTMQFQFGFAYFVKCNFVVLQI